MFRSGLHLIRAYNCCEIITNTVNWSDTICLILLSKSYLSVLYVFNYNKGEYSFQLLKGYPQLALHTQRISVTSTTYTKDIRFQPTPYSM
jgi:hypothetical protein